MSGQFEHYLVEHLREFLVSRPPNPGQILLAKFDSTSVTDRFASILAEELGGDGPPVEVDGNEISLPVYMPDNGVPTYILRVKPEITTDDPDDHEVVQGFATQMRNLISESANSSEPRAMLMILDTDSSLDTLEASEDLFAEDGPINLESFKSNLIDPSGIDSIQGRAFLKGLDKVISSKSIQTSNTDVLDVLCQIRGAAENEEFDKFSDLVGRLPQFLYDDMLTEQFLSDKENEDDLVDAIEQTLNSNHKHADKLRRAHRAGIDTETRLNKNYDDTFTQEVLELGEWSRAKHSQARKYEATDNIRRFLDLDITAKRERIYTPQNDSSKTQQALLLVAKDGDVSVTAEFTGDLGDTPYECIDSNGDDVGRVSKRKERVTASIEDLDPETPHFATFQFYVGKETTGGKPTHQFDLAIVPEWFFLATDGDSFNIDVSEEVLLLPRDQELHLDQLERIDFNFDTKEIEITESGQTVRFDSELTIQSNPSEVTDRLPFYIARPEGVPVKVAFLTEPELVETEEIVLPLMLSAIVNPTRWTGEQLMLPDQFTIDSGRGEIYQTSGESVRLEDSDLELLQIEEQFLDGGSPLGREVQEDSLSYGQEIEHSTSIPEPLLEAYQNLFDHFSDRKRTPSTDTWDKPTQELVEDVLVAYIEAAEKMGSSKTFSPSAPLRSLGTIQSTTSQKIWLTPFHPVLLAYGLRIAEWRDSELQGTAEKGFRRDEFVDKFSPSGILPYRNSDSSENLLRGLRYRDHPLWQIYSPVEAPGAVTPSYMERVIRDKLFTFVQAFPTLFSLHSERHMVINLINMGDLESVIKGLFKFYKKIASSDFDSPTILLRIYGGDGEGESLDQFFNNSSESRLRSTLESKDDQLVDTLRRKVHYIHAGEYKEDNQKPAHITFFRGLLEERAGINTELGDLPSGMLKEGLFSQESIDVGDSPEGVVYTVGFSCDDDETGLIHNVARVANALEAGVAQDSYQLGQAPKKRIESSQDTNLAKLWENSLWVAHVQPNVGIEFYLRSEAEMQRQTGQLMIHYSDQYDQSSPNYDVITSTNKRDPYLMSLRRVLRESELSGQLDAEDVLSTLVGIDGDLALKLQRANDTEIVEFIGFVGGLALSQDLLERDLPDHVWVPISLNELARHDRSYQGDGTGLLQFDSRGKASDDLCFVGVPEDPANTTLKLWLVETKGGTSKIKTGREQIKGALENLREWLQPESQPADEQILLSQFGKIILDVAHRLYNYEIFSDEDLTHLEARKRGLLEGEFNISFLTDMQGHIGEVIRIRQNTFQSEFGSDGEVRSMEAPIEALGVLSGDPIEDVLPDLNLADLRFDNREPTSTRDRTEDAESEPDIVESEPDSITEPRTEDADPDSSDAESSEPEAEQKPTSEASQQEQSEADDSEEETTDTGNVHDDSDSPEESQPDESTEAAVDKTEPKADQDGPDGSTAPEAQTTDSTDIIADLEDSPTPETDVDPSSLVSDLKRAFDSLDIDIHPPNPGSVSVGPRKVGVNVIPKESQKTGGILRNLDTLSVQIQSHGDIVGTRVPEKGAVRLEIPHGDPRDIYLSEGLEALGDRIHDPLVFPIGVDTDNEHHLLSLVDERHALIGGATGSGKSNFLMTVVTALAATHDPGELNISLIDPKGVDFGAFASLPHVQQGGYFNTPEEGTEHLLNMVEEELERRRNYLVDTGASSLAELYENQDAFEAEPFPFHVVVIDEYADLLMSVDDKNAFEKSVTRLAQIGRALGIVILLGTQRPSADIVSGKIKTNFPCRISFRLPSNTDSRVILDEPGAEDLQGAGDMIVHSQSGAKLNLQGYYLTPADRMTLINSISNKHG